jgi:hypothetical protein
MASHLARHRPLAKELITDCDVDPDRRAVFADCTETYGMDDQAPESDWPWNVLSKRAIAYSCGIFCQPDAHMRHRHDSDEFRLCRRLATEAGETMGEMEIGMGSDSLDPFRPYFVVADVDAPPPSRITEATIREAFAGTIFPPAEITIEPLAPEGSWWDQVYRDCVENEDAKVDPVTMEYGRRKLERWRAMVAWFQNCAELTGSVFVMIGENPVDPSSKNCACVFPRFAVGLTKAGSLVGIGGWVVHT